MEARLQPRPGGVLPIVTLLAVVVALLVGTTLGYLVKPASPTAGPTRYVVLPVEHASADPYGCQFHSGHKGC